MKEYLEKYNDILFLSLRIKEIDPNYELFRNRKTQRFEVHNFCQRGASLVMAFDEINPDVVVRLVKTRNIFAKRFFDEIEEHNKNLEQKNIDNLKSKTNDVINEIAKYSFLKNRDLTDLELQKILKL